MAGSKAKASAKILLENPGMPIGEAMRQGGYSVATSRVPKKLTETKTFQEIMAEISDEEIISHIRDIALDRTDKRASLQASDMILKLKDRYPAGKLKVQQFNEELERLQADPE